MNINVMVVNLPGDFHVADARERALSKPYAVTPGEEVIELTPQNGAWVGKGCTKAAREDAHYGLEREPRALYFSRDVATYDRNGNIRHRSEDKGLRINITA